MAGSATVASLNTKINADPRGLVSGFAQAQKSIGGFQQTIGSFQSRLVGMFAGVGAAGGLGFGIKLANDAQTAKVSLEVLTGSAKTAGKLFDDLKQVSQSTPILGFGDLLTNARTMVQFGVAAENVVPSLKAIGEVTAGSAERGKLMTLAFSQMSAAGRLMGQDLLQMINAGFNPLSVISAQTGKTIAELKKDMEAGAISSDMVTKAFIDATSAGGKFNGLLARIGAETIGGKWAALQKKLENFSMTVGTSVIPALSKLIDVAQPLATWIATLDTRTVAAGVGFVAFAAGTYATVRAVSAVVAVVPKLVAAYRAVASAQAIALAFSGPGGWAMLAVGAIAAAGAVAGVSAAFADVEKQSAKAAIAAKEVEKIAVSAVTAKPKIDTVTRSVEDLTKALGDVGKRSFEDAMKAMDERVKRGEEITKEARSPQLKFQDTVTELEQLRQAGAITGDVFVKAFGNANDELRKAIESSMNLKDSLKGVEAVTVGSTKGFSAIQEGIRAAEESQRAELAFKREMQNVDLGQAFKNAKPVDFGPLKNPDSLKPFTGDDDFKKRVDSQLKAIEKNVSEKTDVKAYQEKRLEDSRKAIEYLQAIKENTKKPQTVIKKASI